MLNCVYVCIFPGIVSYGSIRFSKSSMTVSGVGSLEIPPKNSSASKTYFPVEDHKLDSLISISEGESKGRHLSAKGFRGLIEGKSFDGGT